MKQTIIALTVFASAISVHAQKINSSDVPAAVSTEFKSLYSEITTIQWEKEAGNYEANFKKGQTEMSVTISPSGKLVETETAIAITALPKAVSDYIAKNLQGKKIKEASEIKDAAGKVTYEAEVDGTDYTFDDKGNFLKKEKDND